MRTKIALAVLPCVVIVAGIVLAGYEPPSAQKYEILEPVTAGALTVFPVTGTASAGADNFLTLDEGLRSGEVIVTERGRAVGLVRPRPGVLQEVQPVFGGGPQVNSLTLVNQSKRPLLLLAGEIVSGGKQDRVVGKDRIVGPHSEVDLGVFCVEPHRWTESAANFNSVSAAMVQPSVRKQAMVAQNQQQVWDQVARARATMQGAVPEARGAIDVSSSYIQAVEAGPVKREITATVAPIEQRFQELTARVRDRHAIGVVVAMNGRIMWADVFASPALFNRYWPKLIRSYAAESMTRTKSQYFLEKLDPRAFLNDLTGLQESSEGEPGLFRNTKVTGRDFEAFLLTALLPGTGYVVHLTKMARL